MKRRRKKYKVVTIGKERIPVRIRKDENRIPVPKPVITFKSIKAFDRNRRKDDTRKQIAESL